MNNYRVEIAFRDNENDDYRSPYFAYATTREHAIVQAFDAMHDAGYEVLGIRSIEIKDGEQWKTLPVRRKTLLSS